MGLLGAPCPLELRVLEILIDSLYLYPSQGRLLLPPNLHPPTAVSTGVIDAGKFICGGRGGYFCSSPFSGVPR